MTTGLQLNPDRQSFVVYDDNGDAIISGCVRHGSSVVQLHDLENDWL